jgi:ATP-dependent RNA circularization protein (DNA/RNA ligase family)
LFDIYDIDEGRYFNSEERNEFAADFGIEHVPVIQFNSLVEFNDIQCVLTFAEGKSIINPVVEREGLVFKCVEKPDISFKSISNRFLIKNGD